MEYEVRFYFSTGELSKILKKLRDFGELKCLGRTFERTVQYEHPCKEFSFYQESVDGRLRLRETRRRDVSQYKISWKRRVPGTAEAAVNREEEVELTILPEEIKDAIFLIEEVLHLGVVESYERYRVVFENRKVEIAVDEYPFGVAVEVEAKKGVRDPEAVVAFWVKKIGLDLGDAYRLSWDDKYRELCREQGVEQLKHVVFGAEMPGVED